MPDVEFQPEPEQVVDAEEQVEQQVDDTEEEV